MTNEELLFEKNNTKGKTKIKITQGMVVYEPPDSMFNYTTLKSIINFLNYVHEKYRGIKIPISFELGNIYFIDKLVYVLFECICDCLISNWGHDVYVQFNNEDTIWTAGICSSPLLLLKTGEKKHIQKFKQKFNIDIYHHHYRRIVKGCEQKDSIVLSKIMSEIESFLKTFSVQKECRDEITEVIVELMGNAGEHTGSDCLIDLDVSHGYRKKGDSSNYYGINLAIVNFSGKLLGDGLKEKILGEIEYLDDRHKEVKIAYQLHRKNFGEKYTKNDFFNIASFQNRISEREKTEHTGGTGLPKLIKSLEQRSDSHRCYVISGDRGVIFLKRYLEYNSENWIGFNKEKDFLSNIPALESVEESQIYFPGTAYNLNFVMKGEDENE